MHAALLANGLCLPAALTNIKTTLAGNKHYDHILHHPQFTKSFADTGGVCQLFSKADAPWFGVSAERLSYQLSDHFPVWAQVRIDTDGEKLDQLIGRR